MDMIMTHPTTLPNVVNKTSKTLFQKLSPAYLSEQNILAVNLVPHTVFSNNSHIIAIQNASKIAQFPNHTKVSPNKIPFTKCNKLQGSMQCSSTL